MLEAVATRSDCRTFGAGSSSHWGSCDLTALLRTSRFLVLTWPRWASSFRPISCSGS